MCADKRGGGGMLRFQPRSALLGPTGYEHIDARPGPPATVLMCDIAEGSECANATILD